jgi:uncharacterized protein involved in type VI secretion and phage assembly
MKQFFGKYRGKVESNTDTKNLGRIQVSVPLVLGDCKQAWALPSVPYAGSQIGFFFIPPLGANVWVEFESGNIDYPIWTGCFWGDGELPSTASAPEIKLIKTSNATIMINDQSGSSGITIETTSGMKIVITTSDIQIDDGQGGKIALSGPKVTINDGALEVV